MVAFVIAGKANDPSFARVEYAAKQVQAMVPNIFVQLEMKHPDHWRSFLVKVCRLYDFSDYPEDYAGPLVWTLEGELVGGGAEFIQQICVEQFGIQDPPPITDPIFKMIAAENLEQVKQKLQRERSGPSLPERCNSSQAAAEELGLLEPVVLQEGRRFFSHGTCVEVRISPMEDAKRNREAFGDGQAAHLDARLSVCKVGQEESHQVFLHPRPLFPKQMVLVQSRVVTEVSEEAPASAEAAEAEAPVEAPPAPTAQEAPLLAVPPHRIRTQPEEDLSVQDFTAALELLQVGGVATWSVIATDRHPLETHLQVLPFPLAASPLRYPLELLFDRLVREMSAETVPSFQFKHVFMPVPQPAEGGKLAELAKAVSTTYEAAMLKLAGIRRGTSRLVAFTGTWVLVVPLNPPQPGTPEHEVWLRLPPLNPCGLCGVVICPLLEQGFPETAGGTLAGQRLVSSRAEEEGIPEDAAEYEAARKEVRISSQIYERPLETLGFWAES